MSLYEKWSDVSTNHKSQKEYKKFWDKYFDIEKSIYQKILKEGMANVNGKVFELSKTFSIDDITFIGFLDGINTSLEVPLDLNSLEEHTEISFKINFEKLYFNMHQAKANWLYNLEEWNNILSVEKRDELLKEYRASKIAVSNKIGRNDRCICGSGKKYKNCCINKEVEA